MARNRLKSEKKAKSWIRKASRILSMRIVSVLKESSVSANQMTLISLMFAIAAALSFSHGTRHFNVIGLLLYLASFVCDCVDGDLARIKGKTSALGEWFDAATGKMSTFLLFAGIALGQIKHHDPGLVWGLAFLGIAGFYLTQSLVYKYIIIELKKSRDQTKADKPVQKLAFSRMLLKELLAGGVVVCYFLIAAVILHKMLFFLWISALYMWAYYLLQIFCKSRKLWKEYSG